MPESARQPNMLMIIADQLSALATSPYGNEYVQTPHMQALADRGALFEHCYCNFPLCVPSRASIVSGRLCSAIESYDNGCELPASTPTFMHHLRLGGYETVLSGKMHFIGPDQLHGFERRLTTDIFPANYDLYRPWDVQGNPPRPANPANPAMALHLKHAGPVAWSDQLEYDEEVHYRALEQLRAYGRRGAAGRPWFMCVSYTHPHDPPLITPEYWERYADVDIPPPETPPSGYTPHESDTWVITYCGIDVATLTPDDIARSRRGYFAMTSYFDDKVGALLAELGRLRLADDTIVIVTADHGDMAGEHGMWFKRSAREWSARVPLIVAAPGRYAAGLRIRENVSLVDLYPSLLAMTGLEWPSDLPRALDGHDFTPFLRGETVAWPNEAVIENYGAGTIKPVRALVQERYKYIHVNDLPPQLYDLARDPNEWVNLAGDPAYASVETALREHTLAGWDGVALERRIVESQHTRQFVKRALKTGTNFPWDFQPLVDATKVYSRRSRAAGPDAVKAVVTGFEQPADGRVPSTGGG